MKGTEAENIEKTCFLACFLYIAQPAFLYIAGPPKQVGITQNVLHPSVSAFTQVNNGQVHIDHPLLTALFAQNFLACTKLKINKQLKITLFISLTLMSFNYIFH